MPIIVTQPDPAVRQLSGNDPAGKPLLSVLARRAYRISGGRPVPEPEFPALVEEPVFSEDGALLTADTDLFPFKPATDVVVKGAGYAHGRRSSGRTEVTLAIGRHSRTLSVCGDRRAALDAAGRVVFSDPSPFDRIPLTFDRAYGGRDAEAEKEAGFPWEGVFGDVVPATDATPETASPWIYPRNPAGRGYLIRATRSALERVRLPNVEDPADLLTPERLAAGDVANWPRQPLPAGMDWVSYEWFPRIAMMGIVPAFEPGAGPFAEVARGFAPADVADPAALTSEKAFRFTCGAAPGLQLPWLRGGEPVRLLNLSPRGPAVAWTLPAAPRMFTDGRKGRMNPTEPVLHTVVLEPDEDRLTVVWRGSAPALRAYLPDELARMPLRVEWRD